MKKTINNAPPLSLIDNNDSSLQRDFHEKLEKIQLSTQITQTVNFLIL